MKTTVYTFYIIYKFYIIHIKAQLSSQRLKRLSRGRDAARFNTKLAMTRWSSRTPALYNALKTKDS